MQEEEPSICLPENYDSIFRKWYGPITNFIYYKCGNLSEAEDIAQNVFLQLWRRCAKVSFSKVKSYLFTSANNSFLNKKAHEKVVLRHLKATPQKVDNDSPEFILETKEFHSKLKAAIGNLPSKERTVFLLSRIENKTYQEIAEIEELTVKAIERRMSKALLLLREQLGKELKF